MSSVSRGNSAVVVHSVSSRDSTADSVSVRGSSVGETVIVVDGLLTNVDGVGAGDGNLDGHIAHNLDSLVDGHLALNGHGVGLNDWDGNLVVDGHLDGHLHVLDDGVGHLNVLGDVNGAVDLDGHLHGDWDLDGLLVDGDTHGHLDLLVQHDLTDLLSVSVSVTMSVTVSLSVVGSQRDGAGVSRVDGLSVVDVSSVVEVSSVVVDGAGVDGGVASINDLGASGGDMANMVLGSSNNRLGVSRRNGSVRGAGVHIHSRGGQTHGGSGVVVARVGIGGGEMGHISGNEGHRKGENLQRTTIDTGLILSLVGEWFITEEDHRSRFTGILLISFNTFNPQSQDTLRINPPEAVGNPGYVCYRVAGYSASYSPGTSFCSVRSDEDHE